MEKRKSKIERANDVGIYLRNYDIGEQRIICPTCSPTRKKRNDNCLAITITDDAILWFCHHCEWQGGAKDGDRSEEHTSELQSRLHLVCRLLLEKKNSAKSRDTPQKQ